MIRAMLRASLRVVSVVAGVYWRTADVLRKGRPRRRLESRDVPDTATFKLDRIESAAIGRS